MDLEKNLPWWRFDRPWGFRFSFMDGIIILVGLTTAFFAFEHAKDLSISTIFVMGHFFLFCNVFRLGGERSLIWIGILFLNVIGWVFLGVFRWEKVIFTQIVFTVLLILNRVLSKNYNGFMCEKINPKNFKKAFLAEGLWVRKVLLTIKMPKRIIEILTDKKWS